MSDKDSFYYLNAYQDGLTPGQQVTIQHRISFNDWRAGPHIAPLVGLAGEEIMRRKEASIALEKDLYAQLKKLAEAWDEQAAQTMLSIPRRSHILQMSGRRGRMGYGRSATAPISCGIESPMKRPPIVTLSAGGSFTTPLSSQTPNIQITGATASMWRDRTRKNTPLWRRHSITFRAVLICTVTCFGSCPRRFPMSADGCSASTAIWPPDTYWPLLTNQNQASRQWMTCWPVWTMWIWQSHAPSHLKKAGKSRVNP